MKEKKLRNILRILVASILSTIFSISGYCQNLDYTTVFKAAEKHSTGKRGDSYYTTARITESLGGDSNGYNWLSNKSYQGMTLEKGLSQALSNQDLKPAMIIYINNSPGTDPSSTIAKYSPHWLVYLGKDDTGVDRFGDQYSVGYSLVGTGSLVAMFNEDKNKNSRKIDEILDPFKRQNQQVHEVMESPIVSEEEELVDHEFIASEDALENALDGELTDAFNDINEPIDNQSLETEQSSPQTSPEEVGPSQNVNVPTTKGSYGSPSERKVIPGAHTFDHHSNGSNSNIGTKRRNFKHPFRKAQLIAWNQASGVPKENYRSAYRTAKALGAKGDGWSWQTNKEYQSQSMLKGIRSAIRQGDLLPGMIVYINNKPGADPASTNMKYQPHWFTYLGKDREGKDRFSDQFNADWSLEGPYGIVAEYSRDAYGNQRLIDEILDPYATDSIN